jgi:hypothetical protein
MLLLLFALTANASSLPQDPLFYKGECVIYKTGFFLHKACSGHGIIVEVDQNKAPFEYTIEAPADEVDCPPLIYRYENEIKAAK